jgi:TatD DNase family protein
MELVDTHCHLFMDPLLVRLSDVLVRARAAAVNTIIVPAYDLASWSQVTELSTIEGVYPAYGLHPWAAIENLEPAMLERALVENRAVAVGEIGLDFMRASPDKERQISALRLQLDVAASLDLPVLLHCRGAFEELFQLIKERGTRVRGVLHAFSKGPELGQRFIGLGLCLALGGALTRPNAKRAKHTATLAPIDCLLLETDAPSIGLEGVLPEETEPRHVAIIAQRLAELRGESLDAIAMRTTLNARRLFNI